MEIKRAVVVGLGALLAVPAIMSAALATLSSRPNLAARILGWGGNAPKYPHDLGLESTDVEYRTGCSAWWTQTDGAVGAVVIVHGFEPTEDPRSTDVGPGLEVAAILQRHRFNSLIVNLGYASGQHPHSGGELEARDVIDAVEWVRNDCGLPVAIVGFSAGGHASLIAAARSGPFAVFTDSSFVDGSEIVKDQGALNLGVPKFLFALVPGFIRLLTGHQPVDLASMPSLSGIAALHIHGDADTAIAYENLKRIAILTGGKTITIPGGDHLEAFAFDPAAYEEQLIGFLTKALPQQSVGS